jgi:hypothetical protein
MTFLLGKHATLGQEPPMYLRSTTAVRLPSLAIVQAMFAGCTAACTRTSYFSAAFMCVVSIDGRFAATGLTDTFLPGTRVACEATTARFTDPDGQAIYANVVATSFDTSESSASPSLVLVNGDIGKQEGKP